MIAVANPNNPTGAVAIRKICCELRCRTASGSAGGRSVFRILREVMLAARSALPNLFVARTFSKAYGLAGLRIGSLVGDVDQMARCAVSLRPTT